MVKTIPLFCILTSVVLLTYADTIDGNVAPLSCGGKVFVEDSVVIDIPSLRGDECVWNIQTQDDRILVFTLINESFEDVQDYLTVHDGFGKDSPILQIEDQRKYEASNKDLHPAIYTTSSVATLRSTGTRSSVLQLKIQKAIECPFNLGPNTACGRVVDETSCYCANFAPGNRADQMIFCYNNYMKLVSLESYDEEQKIVAAWNVNSWSSLTDQQSEGTWIWETTGAPMMPGYVNWNSGEPSGAGVFGEEDCMAFPEFEGGWNDVDCYVGKAGICELHP